MRAWVRSVPLALLLALYASAADDGTRLAPLFAAQVDRRLNVPEAEQRYYADLLSKQLATVVDEARSQYVLIVDSNVYIQALLIYWRDPEGDFDFIGASPVATGKTGQYDHFETPLGVFDHSIDNPDFRAEGTKNELGIRGYGLKGMRVYDFGWQTAVRGWGDGGESQMRLQMHATDPDQLEPLLGRRHSKGCIRIPATLNTFIDHYGILDADYEDAMAAGKTFWVLLPTREPTPWSGRYLVIVDTHRSKRPKWVSEPAHR